MCRTKHNCRYIKAPLTLYLGAMTVGSIDLRFRGLCSGIRVIKEAPAALLFKVAPFGFDAPTSRCNIGLKPLKDAPNRRLFDMLRGFQVDPLGFGDPEP